PGQPRVVEERIAITVRRDGEHFDAVTRSLPLDPERSARTTPEGGLASCNGLLDRVAVGPRQHRHCTSRWIPDHDRDETVRIELQVRRIHAALRTGTPAAASASFTAGTVISPR